ncbi:hypothetical protein P5V15_012004 [Pogonomyrmex californicus]
MREVGEACASDAPREWRHGVLRSRGETCVQLDRDVTDGPMSMRAVQGSYRQNRHRDRVIGLRERWPIVRNGPRRRALVTDAFGRAARLVFALSSFPMYSLPIYDFLFFFTVYSKFTKFTHPACPVCFNP